MFTEFCSKCKCIGPSAIHRCTGEQNEVLIEETDLNLNTPTHSEVDRPMENSLLISQMLNRPCKFSHSIESSPMAKTDKESVCAANQEDDSNTTAPYRLL